MNYIRISVEKLRAPSLVRIPAIPRIESGAGSAAVTDYAPL